MPSPPPPGSVEVERKGLSLPALVYRPLPEEKKAEAWRDPA
jgi:hypothetical protein